jgi:hypothetical protein
LLFRFSLLLAKHQQDLRLHRYHRAMIPLFRSGVAMVTVVVMAGTAIAAIITDGIAVEAIGDTIIKG